ncbi:MAG: hypothetical protein ABEJ05_04920 [Haloglomus sp.]
MRRRAFLGALASGGAAALAGCVSRQTVERVSATPEIPRGEFYHVTLRLGEPGKQFNLRYEVTAEKPFDVLLFGGQIDPAEYDAYRRAVKATRGEGGSPPGGEPGNHPDADHAPGNGPENCPLDPVSRSPGHEGEHPDHSACPRPSKWHSVVGTRHGEVNKPLRSGVHHFVVDNTALGEATPTGTLRPTVDLQVRDFEILSS